MNWDDYRQAAATLIAGGVDLLLVETVFDTLNAKAALLGCRLAMDACGVELPIMVSATFPDTSGRLLSGQTGRPFGRPSPMQDPHSRQQLRAPVQGGPTLPGGSGGGLPLLLSAHLNAGLPNARGVRETPGDMADDFASFAGGGLSQRSRGMLVRRRITLMPLPAPSNSMRRARCPILPGHATERPRGLFRAKTSSLLGERCNVTGSVSNGLILEGSFEQALEVARTCVEDGAQIIECQHG